MVRQDVIDKLRKLAQETATISPDLAWEIDRLALSEEQKTYILELCTRSGHKHLVKVSDQERLLIIPQAWTKPEGLIDLETNDGNRLFIYLETIESIELAVD